MRRPQGSTWPPVQASDCLQDKPRLTTETQLFAQLCMHMLYAHQTPTMQAAAGLRSLLLCPALLRSSAAPVWAAKPRLLTSLRAFRSPATSSVLVKQQPHAQPPRRRGPPAASAAAEAVQTASRSFADMGLSPGLQAAMAEHNLSEPTDIQVWMSAGLNVSRNSIQQPPVPSK